MWVSWMHLAGRIGIATVDVKPGEYMKKKFASALVVR
jgi:hypothetical protein